MVDEEFSWLVARLETQSAAKPRAFRNKVLLVCCAAYVLFFIALFCTLSGSAWAVSRAIHHGVTPLVLLAGVAGFGAMPFVFVLLNELFTTTPAPAGRELTRSEAPVLFKMLDKMREKLGGPRIDWVLVDTEYSASLVRVPRWGVFGPSTNYLMLGLPFMFGQSATELMATVAHEYGHLCGAHGKVSTWMVGQRRLLAALHDRLHDNEDASPVHSLLARACDAVMPYFSAYTFVLARQDAIEADRTAGRLSGRDVAAASLIRSNLLASWFHQQFWTTLYRQADSREAPAFMPYKSMPMAFQMSHDEWANKQRLKDAWSVDSGVTDTRPCLRERVEALGQKPAVPGLLEKSAAATLLGRAGGHLADEFDKTWWAAEKKDWAERHRYVRRSLQRLKELGVQSLPSLPLNHLQELARLKTEFETATDAKPVLEYLMRQPGGPFPKAAYSLGCILLDEDNASGLDYLVIASRDNAHLAGDAVNAGYTYLLNKFGEAQAQAWCNKIVIPQAA